MSALIEDPPPPTHTHTHTHTHTIGFTGGPFTVTATDMINLTSTIASEEYLLWPEEEVIFSCETRGLVLEWTSDDYIGEGGVALEFNVFIDNLGDIRTVDQTGSTAILTDVDHNMASQLRIKTSSQFPTSSVSCTNFNRTSTPITFSVLGMYHTLKNASVFSLSI